MPFDTKKQCRGCAFWLPDMSVLTKADDGSDGEPKRGQCRRFPPVDNSRDPPTTPYLFGCGEHKPG